MYIYDYNSYNLKYYNDQIQSKIHVFQPPISTSDHIDILFYGTLNERRNKILGEFKKKVQHNHSDQCVWRKIK